jgi:sterol desaturase/sphingolipid hydroxylase (fatty acid hydroxylase superfamily)
MLGTFWGVTHHLLGADAQPFSVFGFDALLFVGVMTVLHLRHTHLWITVPGVWASILQTPAHHQIHHSADPRHFDKNLGLFLSVWDRAFGTLWIPRPEEKATLVLGLGEGKGHHSFVDAWATPFADAARTLVPVRPAPEAPTPVRLPAE